MAAGARVKMHGQSNNLIYLIKQDKSFGISDKEIDKLIDPVKFTGCASEQTKDFIDTQIKPLLREYADVIGAKGDVLV